MKNKRNNQTDKSEELEVQNAITFVNTLAQLGPGNHILECPECGANVIISTIMNHGSLHGRAKCTKCSFLIMM